jgi:hypothetical protein
MFSASEEVVMQSLRDGIDPEIASEITAWIGGPGGAMGVGSRWGSVIDTAAPEPRPPRRRTAPPPRVASGQRKPLDRERERSLLVETVRQGRSLLVVGQAGSGRTTLLEELAETIVEERPVCLVSAAGGATASSTARDVLQTAFEQLYEPEPGVVRSLDDLAARLSAVSAVLIVDDADERCAPLVELVRGLVLASESTAGFAGVATLDLGGLDEAAAIGLAELALGGFVDVEERDAAANLAVLSGGHPQRILDATALARAAGRPLTAVVEELDQAGDPDAAAAASAQRLTPEERRVLAALSVLREATPEQLEAIASTGPELDAALVTLEHLQLARRSEEGRLRSIPRETEALTTATEIAEALDGTFELLRNALEEHQLAADALLGEAGILLHVLELALKQQRHKDVVKLGRAVVSALVLALRLGAAERALELIAESARLVGDPATQSWALHELGALALVLGDPQRAFAMAGQAERLASRGTDPVAKSLTRRSLAIIEQAALTHPPDRASGRRRLALRPARRRWLALLAALALLAGVTAYVAAANGSSRLPAPVDLAAASPTRHAPRIHWRPVAHAAAYQVTRHGGSLPDALWIIHRTHLTVPAGTGDGVFVLSVDAVDAQHHAGREASLSVVVDRTAPPMPAGFIGRASGRQIALTWQRDDSATSYVVADQQTSFSRRTRATSTAEVVPRDGSFSYALRAVDAAGNVSPPARTSVSTVLVAPVLTTTDSAVTRRPVTLEWSGNVVGASGYVLYRTGTVGPETWPLGPVNRFTDATITRDGTATYRVQAVLGSQHSGDSNPVGVAIVGVPLRAPKLKIVPPGALVRVAPRLEWTKVPGAAGYLVERRGAAPLSRSLDRSTSSLLEGHLADGVYRYTVQAIGADRTPGAASNTVTFTIDTTPPAPPSDLRASSRGSTVRLTWRADPDVSSYVVSDDATGWTRTVSASTVSETVGAPGTYHYRVHGIDRAGNVGRDAATSAVVQLEPPKLSLKGPNPTRSGPALAWTKPPGATTYRLTRSGPAGSTIPVQGTSFTDATPGPDGTYTYVVRALASDGTAGPPSNAVTVTYDTTPPGAPEPSARANGATITISWADVAGASSYRVTDSQAGTVVPSNAGTTRTTTTEPGAGRYAFAVVAIDAAGNTSRPGAASATVLAAPSLSSLASDTPTLPLLSWLPVPGASNGYQVTRNDGSITAVATTRWIDRQVVADMHYTYTVVALDKAGDVGIPSVGSTTYDPPPGSPAPVSATRPHGATAVHITWTLVPRAVKYLVTRDGTLIGSPKDTVLDDPDLLCSKVTYSVTAVTAGGREGPSATASYDPGPC